MTRSRGQVYWSPGAAGPVLAADADVVRIGSRHIAADTPGITITLLVDALGIGDESASDGSWQDRAICNQTDPEAFFPEKGGSTREAKRVCRSCPVRAECLEYALARDERFGIWGGLSERERRRLKRQAA